MTRQKRHVLVHVVAVAAVFLVLPITFLVQIRSVTAVSEMASLDAGSAACDTLADPMERGLCHFVTGIYPDGLLTNWPNPRLPGHIDHAPMRDYAEPPDQEVISESTSMLALIAAQLGDQTTFDYLVDVSAPAEIGGTGAPMSSSRESPYYFASPNLCLTHWVLDKDGRKEDPGTDWHANAAGEESRWLEALSIAEQRFPERRDSYRLFANCLAWGLMGATDFDPRAIGNFEDPGTPEEFDNFLMRPYFGWRDDFSAFATVTTTNLSYNNLMGWRYARKLGQEPHHLYSTTEPVTGTETITVPSQAVGSVRIDMTRDSNTGYELYEVQADSPFTDANLLLNAACASSSHAPDDSCENAVDGDPSTRWHSTQTGPQWLVITPTHASRITTVTLHWGKDDPPEHALSATWPFADFYANVLRYTTPLMADSIQHCGTDLPRVMYDVKRHFYYGEILTPNLTCSMVVTPTASSTQDRNPDLAPPKSIDCDPTTRWSSNRTDDEWIALEFDEPVTVDGVVLRWEQAFGKAYTIDVSDDGRTWTSVFAETNGDGQVDEIHFPLTTTRHIRMHGSSRGQVQGKIYGYSLFEFEVYRGGTSSLTALDLARRAGVYAKESDDAVLWKTGRRILDWYRARYPSIAAAYDPCTGEPLPGDWENGEWPSIMADLAELAAEYGECDFARQVIAEKLRPKLNTDRNDKLLGTVGPSAFENLEVLLALRRAAVDPCCGSITRQWQELHPISSSPPSSAGHTAVYDKDNQRMVVYGVAPFVTDTYSLILKLGRESWERLTPTGTAPRLEGGHSAIICGPGNRMIIWSGKHGTVEARALDLTLGRERWVTIPVTGVVPPGRTGHSAVCDSANNRMIIFGGYFGAYPYFRNDTWALYLTPGEERWEELTPEPEPRPAIRASHAAIYDESNQRMIVYGGTTWRWGRHGDVWALDLTLGDETWEELFPSCAYPAPRTASPAVYDAASDRMLFFGGDAGGGYLNDAAALNLAAGREEWHGIVPSGTVPEKRAGHSAIYDVMNRRVVIFGGMNSTGTLGDVFTLPEPRIFLPYVAKKHEIPCSYGPVNPPSSETHNLDDDALDWGIDCENSPKWSRQVVASPPLDDTALAFSITGGEPYSNIHCYRSFLPELDARAFKLTLSFWFTPTTTCNNVGGPSVVQALEFAMNKWQDSNRYEWALQWQNVGAGAPQWRYWDARDEWLPLPTPIAQCLMAGRWYALTLQGELRNGQVYFRSFSIDGQEHNLDISVFPADTPGEPDRLGISIQLDGNSEQDPYRVVIGHVSFVRKPTALPMTGKWDEKDGTPRISRDGQLIEENECDAYGVVIRADPARECADVVEVAREP